MNERCETCGSDDPDVRLCPYGADVVMKNVHCRNDSFHMTWSDKVDAFHDTPASEPTPSEDDLTGVERVEMGLAEAMIATRVADAVREEREACAEYLERSGMNVLAAAIRAGKRQESAIPDSERRSKIDAQGEG